MATLTSKGVGAPDSVKYTSGKPIVPSTIPYKKSITLTDMAELAARVGSPISMDRRGDVIFYDDLESGVGKMLAGVATGGAGTIRASSATARSGFLSAKIFVPGTVANDYTEANWEIPFVTGTKMGAEIYFSTESLTRHRGCIDLGIMDQYAGGRYHGIVRISFTDYDPKVYYLPSTGTAWRTDRTLLDHFPIQSGNITSYRQLKLVCDLTTHKYERLIVANREWDLSSFAMEVETAAAFLGEHTMVWVCVYGLTAGLDITMYVDDLIATINEPPNE